jgi:hypothetical protein
MAETFRQTLQILEDLVLGMHSHISSEERKILHITLLIMKTEQKYMVAHLILEVTNFRVLYHIWGSYFKPIDWNS